MYSVFLYDQPLGVIERRGAGIRFTYDKSAMEDDGIPALSLSLPKRAEPYADRQAGAFFRNLLPEQAYRRLVARAAGATPDDATALLGAIGGECPGAVSIWPEGQTPPEKHEYQRLSVGELEELLINPNSAVLGNAVTRGRLSLPGVQHKVALLGNDEGDAWMLPIRGAVTSHIIKQATDYVPGLLENELLCTALARAVGLDVPDWGLASPHVRAFYIERFDRAAPGDEHGPPRRKLHQEDFCQVLKVEPQVKYQRDGGPGLRQCATVIREQCALPAVDLPLLVRWIGFNCLIGNEDAHSKNIALLYSESGLRLTPHYDLLSTEVYPNLERGLAMKIGRSWDVRNIQRVDWQRMASEVQLPWNTVRSLLLEVADAATASIANVVERHEAELAGSAVVGKIREVLEHHSAQMQRELVAR